MTPDLSPLMVPGVLEAHLDGADVVLSVATEAQALQVLPLFVIAAAIEWLTRLITQEAWPQWPQLVAPFLQTALWPVFGHVLLAPQRRPVDRDDIRPL